MKSSLSVLQCSERNSKGLLTQRAPQNAANRLTASNLKGTHIHTHARTLTHKYIHTHKYTHTHTHKYKYTHTHTHTHTWLNDLIGAFLDAFEKRLRKTTIQFAMSVRPNGTTRPPTDGLT
jgi:hypothetical protein